MLFWHVVDEVHLLNVAVAMEARMRGIGRALMEDLIAYGRANDVARILLEVRETNAVAIGLYESLGFERFNVRLRYYADGVDAVEMALALVAV
jgi:ribosomal-protein-alanine N-acetyltransferase